MGCKANDARKKVWDILEESNVPMNLKKLIANAVEKDYKEKAVRATEALKREAEADIVKAIEEVDDSKIVKEKTKGSLWVMRSKFDPDFGNPFLSKPSKDPKASDFVLPKATNKDLTLAFYNWLENSDNVPAGVSAKTREALNTKRNIIINNMDKVLNSESLVYNSTGANESINPAKVLILFSEITGKSPSSNSETGKKYPTTQGDSKPRAKSATNTGGSKGPTTRVELNSMKELDAYIDSIANSKSEATRAKQKLKFLSSIVPIDKLAVTVQDVLLYDGKNVDGLYHHGDGLIELSREGNLVNTLVHEIVHSLTERALQKSGLSDTVMKLEELRQKAHTLSYTKLGNIPNLVYGLSANQSLEDVQNVTDEALVKSRVAEFVSELVANDELQDLLTKVLREDHKIPREVGALDVVVKLWSRLVSHLTKEDIDSALSDGLTLVRALITEGVTTDGSTKKALIVRAEERSLDIIAQDIARNINKC